MTDFIADLHIHSRFSRATSKHLTPRNLAAWASIKGIDILATGDFTHPGWMEIITEQLEALDNGLFRLRENQGLCSELPWFQGDIEGDRIRFILCTEISSIYKKKGRVRKIHNLVFMPSLDAARRLNTRLAQVGNLASDGRPILGLDAKDLLEMVLETDPLAFLVPAHIWTPWFSLFGSKSGFDCIEDCFEDLSPEIFALETGLSSDPEMNWLWSHLDRFALISNSDAHSGEKLGREVNLFEGEQSFAGLRSALKRESGLTRFSGTVEFYPEEGKYHLDGHRKCQVVLEPRETRKHGGICPVCGKPLTIGVLNRVFELSDRDEPLRPSHQPPFVSLVPLMEILSEILGVGPSSKKIQAMYAQLVHDYGSELAVLRKVPSRDLERSSKALAEAVRRMRHGQVFRHSGFDGEFGRISMFTAGELLELKHGRMLGMAATVAAAPIEDVGLRWRKPATPQVKETPAGLPVANSLQQSAIMAGHGPVLVLAGPGTGKTQTLLGRVRHLMEQGADPNRILILTFTRKAARELKERLQRICPHPVHGPKTDTLHALALEYWSQVMGESPTLLSEDSSRRLFAAANPTLSGKALKTAWQRQSLAREEGTPVPDEYTRRYLDQKARFNLVDYTDLLEFWCEHLRLGHYIPAFDHVLVDEVQDLSPLQLGLVTSLAGSGEGFFAIGDPNQSIYGFRGAVRDIQERLQTLWPRVRIIKLVRNYRSSQQILNLAAHLFPGDGLMAEKDLPASVVMYQAGSAEQEAVWIGDRIQELLGGTGHWQADLQTGANLAPGDIAVLVRLKALIPSLLRILDQKGIPCSVPEDEPFFVDNRVSLLLRMAGNVLGLPDLDLGDLPQCPENLIEKGPLAMAVFLSETPPFDALFWKSKPFVDLVKAYQSCAGWQGVINMVHLETELCAIRSRAQKVQIMTMHAAKGLEFEVVFLAGLEEGILPFAGMDMLLGKAGDDGGPDLEEERRLFYVGLTRAKTMIFMTHCTSRRIFGKTLKLGPSSLARSLPRTLFRKIEVRRQTRRTERRLNLLGLS